MKYKESQIGETEKEPDKSYREPISISVSSSFRGFGVMCVILASILFIFSIPLSAGFAVELGHIGKWIGVLIFLGGMFISLLLWICYVVLVGTSSMIKNSYLSAEYQREICEMLKQIKEEQKDKKPE